MSRTFLVLDIETVPDSELPWDAAKDGFPPPLFHRVVALGVLWLDAELHFRRMGVFGVREDASAEPGEARVLEEFAQFVGREHPNLVTYNGRGFDLPVLANRCLRHGTPFGAYYADRDYRYRYSDVGHIDLAELLTDYGAARRSTLDALARLVGMPGKLEVDGSMVQPMYEAGRLEEIRRYCLQDVAQTAFLFLRVELLRGRIDRATYTARAEELWAALEKDGRVHDVLAAADKKRVVLSE